MDQETLQEKQDLILDLNFVPKWARRPPGENPYLHTNESGEEAGRPAKRGRRTDRDARRSRGGRPADKGSRRSSKTATGRTPVHTDRRARQQERERHAREAHDLPIHVSFVPERQRLGAVVRKIRSSRRAFPLPDVASLFLSSPANYLVKLEVRKAERRQKPVRFYACKVCRTVFLDKENLITHMLGAHIDQYFRMEEKDEEPPSGNFTCVGRCRLSGELLGPPNYHAFNERLQELHRTRFAHMPLEEYRQQIETVHAPEMIEQWKESCRKKTVYYRRNAGEDTPAMNWTEVEAAFRKEVVPKVVRPASRVIVPAEVIRQMPACPLKSLVRDAWKREDRFPLSLMLALRPAFRHMHLHVFKTGQNTNFVTAIEPTPLDAEHAVSNIRQVIEYLREHPGCKKKDLAEYLCPGVPLDSKQVLEALSPLRWLVEKGHVVEFFDGTLSLPASGRGRNRRVAR